jgi:hypothetical protein
VPEIEDPTKISTRAKDPAATGVTRIALEIEDPTKVSTSDISPVEPEAAPTEPQEEKSES